jgi:hypothetical protein
MQRIFLLSPANCAGRRAAILMSGQAQFDLAQRLRAGSASLGEIFSFLSGLYFRGKLTYAQAFAAQSGGSGAWIITSNRGLLSPATLLGLDELRDFAAVPIDLAEPRYAGPLRQCGAQLLAEYGAECEVVLLGSIATAKYVDCLLPLFGERLLFPAEFVGRGDMSRGGLLLRAAAAGLELEYIPVAGAIRRGQRPPRLDRPVRR